MTNVFVLGGCVAFTLVWALLLLRGGRFMRWPQWLRLTNMAVFLAIWGAVIAAGFHEADKQQPTLLSVCWDRGQAVYQDDLITPTCGAPEALRWAKKTKKVYWGLGVAHSTHLDGFNRALAYWNSNLDYLVFEETTILEEADIVITLRDLPGETATSHSIGPSGIASEIRIRSGMIDIRRMMLEVQHELGHALGLAHDSGTSIMHRTLEESNGQRDWVVTVRDKKALKQVMGL